MFVLHSLSTSLTVNQLCQPKPQYLFYLYGFSPQILSSFIKELLLCCIANFFQFCLSVFLSVYLFVSLTVFLSASPFLPSNSVVLAEILQKVFRHKDNELPTHGLVTVHVGHPLEHRLPNHALPTSTIRYLKVHSVQCTLYSTRKARWGRLSVR